jgi:WD40 repeat protein
VATAVVSNAHGPTREDHRIEAMQFIGGRIATVIDRLATISMRDPTTGLEVVRLEGAAGDVVSLVADPTGHRVATGAASGTVTVWDVDEGRRLFRRSNARRPLRFSREGRRLVVIEGDRGAVLDADTGARLSSLDALHPERALDAALTGGGEVLAAGPCVDALTPGEPHAVCVWDAASGIERIRMPYGWVSEHPPAVALSDDARWLAVAQPLAGDVELWDVGSRRQQASVGTFWNPSLDGAYVRAGDGRVDIVGRDRTTMEAFLMCRLGDVAVNFIACRDRFVVPGLLPRILGVR